MGIMYVQWDDSYSIGIDLIDKQHKHLFDFTNMLYEGCRRGETAAKEHFVETLHKTVDYVTGHFSTEERIMEKINYPDTANHKKEHTDFVKKVMESQKDLEEGKKGVAIKFVQFLRDWILSHIAVCDKKFGDYLNKQGVKNLA